MLQKFKGKTHIASSVGKGELGRLPRKGWQNIRCRVTPGKWVYQTERPEEARARKLKISHTFGSMIEFG